LSKLLSCLSEAAIDSLVVGSKLATDDTAKSSGDDVPLNYTLLNRLVRDLEQIKRSWKTKANDFQKGTSAKPAAVSHLFQ
jgi:hypothetical protein